MSYLYMASPYSHPEAHVRAMRYNAVRDAVANYIRQRIWVYSPILHCHDMARECGMGFEYREWHDFNLAMMRKSTSMLVLGIDGWRESKGVQAEISAADAMGLPWRLISGAVVGTPPVRVYSEPV